MKRINNMQLERFYEKLESKPKKRKFNLALPEFLNRERAGLGILLLGLAVSAVGGRIFLNKSNELAEKANSSRVELYNNIYEWNDIDDVFKKYNEEDNVLVYSVGAIMAGLVMAGGGYVLSRSRFEQWTRKQKDYGKSFSTYRRGCH